MGKVVLTMLAHPDDAEILCGGTLVRLAGLGWEVHVATMTAGDCGTMEKDRWEISAIRTSEAAKVPLQISHISVVARLSHQARPTVEHALAQVAEAKARGIDIAHWYSAQTTP